MTRQELEKLWAEPNNWTLVYRCAEDPRLIVPKRLRLGWTVNFGHPLAWIAVLLSVVIAIGPFMLLMFLRGTSAPVLILTLLASVGLLIAVSQWEATRSRE